MNVPDIIGVEVVTPDGRGAILSLHPKKVIVQLHTISPSQTHRMKGIKRNESLHYAYDYKDVEIIKGRYFFNEESIKNRFNLSDNSF